MATLREVLAERLSSALAAAGYPEAQPAVVPTADARFGDYQANSAMGLAKQRKLNPRQVAAEIITHLKVDDISETPEIAGAGFINFRLKNDFLARQTFEVAGDPRLGVTPVSPARKIIVDFSSPNVAKPMHVGHIRSTIIGDCLVRVARFLGHDVVSDNHIGDWGTQFGKVIYGWKHLLNQRALEENPIHELVRLYRDVNELEKTDEVVKKTAREELVKLQAGDEENLAIWRRALEISSKEFERIYTILDVHFDESLGESFYNDALKPLCDRLEAEGVAQISDGALCIFFPEIPALADKAPAIIRKGDGGFGYATTDLATVDYRVQRWQPDAIWYVVGAPQAVHFQQIFATIRRMGLSADCQHIAFGSILGEDKKIMRTRAGESIGLSDVLDDAIQRATAIVAEKNADLPPAEREEIARIIGLGAVKYAELSQNRLTDYVFSWDKMLSFQGNTAPYLQNAYVRIRSIFRRLDQEFVQPDQLVLTEPAERTLALKLLQFAETVPQVLEDFRPNVLANYLYELASTFHGFFETCHVLKSEEPQRSSRLLLCELTARTLSDGLALMGIKCPERM